MKFKNELKYNETLVPKSLKERYEELEKKDPTILQKNGEMFSTNNTTSYNPPNKKVTRLISRSIDSQDGKLDYYEIQQEIEHKNCCSIN